jgi:hypothetical protein
VSGDENGRAVRELLVRRLGGEGAAALLALAGADGVLLTGLPVDLAPPRTPRGTAADGDGHPDATPTPSSPERVSRGGTPGSTR